MPFPYLRVFLLAGDVVFQIKVHNYLDVEVSGNISFYDENVHHAENYSVAGMDTFVDDIVPPEPKIKEITGQVDGQICLPYQHKDNEENKLLFKIVWNIEMDKCEILPESQQYHPVRTTHWDEGEHKVKQTDHFHPITREAVLKTPAHGDNLPTTMIFQSSKQRSTEFGLMVTTSGNECHVNRLPEGKYFLIYSNRQTFS